MPGAARGSRTATRGERPGMYLTLPLLLQPLQALPLAPLSFGCLERRLALCTLSLGPAGGGRQEGRQAEWWVAVELPPAGSISDACGPTGHPSPLLAFTQPPCFHSLFGTLPVGALPLLFLPLLLLPPRPRLLGPLPANACLLGFLPRQLAPRLAHHVLHNRQVIACDRGAGRAGQEVRD